MSKILFLFALFFPAVIFSEEKLSDGAELLNLEKSFEQISKEWERDHDLVFFQKCLETVRASEALGIKPDEFHSKIIDVLSAMLAIGGVNGAREFWGNGSPVRNCQFEALTSFASSTYFTSPGSTKWEENRDRITKNLMTMRLSWTLLRNPHWDNVVIEIDNSTSPTGNSKSDQNAIDIQLQEDLKKFLEESEPIIASFLIATYSTSISDIIKLNESMSLGGYDSKERMAYLLKAASVNHIKLPQSILITLPQ